MPREICSGCKQIKEDVTLCADDRLCRDCYQENERQLAIIAAAKTSATDIPVAEAKGKKPRQAPAKTRKNKGEVTVAQLNTHPDETDKDGNGNDNDTTSCLQDHQQTSPSADHVKELLDLRQLVSSQQLVIEKLQSQLSFIVSFLGITEITDESSSDVPLIPGSTQGLEPCSDHADLHATGATSESIVWTDVVRRRPKHRREISPRDSFQQTVVAAVYIDQSVKKQRENSIIVNGLAPRDLTSDREQFTSLCVKEFQLEPQIAAVKRLGRCQAGKIQPLLVHLKQVDQAKQLITNAKKLRQSTDLITRDTIFINPNLTRAEAAAAYQARSQRRLAQQRRCVRSTGVDGVNGLDIHNSENCTQTDLKPLNPLANSFGMNQAPASGRTD
jgi:hypothetical protein